MASAKRNLVFGEQGLSGKIVESSAQAGDGQVLVELDTGRRVLMPRDQLSRKRDGSFHVPFTPADFDTDTAEQVSASERAHAAEEVRVPVVEEEVRVGKRVAEKATVRVRKRVTTREQIVSEPLADENISIERVALNKLVDSAPQPRQEGDTWIIPVLEEVLIVEKKILVKEELQITRVQQTKEHRQKFSLRVETAEVTRTPRK